MGTDKTNFYCYKLDSILDELDLERVKRNLGLWEYSMFLLKGCLGYFLIAETKYLTPRMKSGKVYVAHNL